MNVQLPGRVLLGQLAAAGISMLVAAWIAPSSVWSVCAGALCSVVPSVLVGQWAWRRGISGMLGAVAHPLIKMVASGAALAVVLGSEALGFARVDPLAALVGFAVCVLAQPAVLIWASARTRPGD